MSNAHHFSVTSAINPYYSSPTADSSAAQTEHNTIRQALEQAGVKVTRVDAPADSQDGVYTANWALVRGSQAILASLPNVRKAAEDPAQAILEKQGLTVTRVPEGLLFSGQGDALPCGDLLFCGKGYRSHEAAQAFAAEHLGYRRVQLQTLPQLDSTGQPVINAVSGLPDSYYYDIDLALAIIAPPTDNKEGIIAYCPEAFTEESRQILETFEEVDKIIVSEHEAREAFATNLVSTGQTVIMSADAPQLAADLQARGLEVIPVSAPELSKGGGFIRCISLSLN